MSTTTAPTPQTELRDNAGLGTYAAPEDGHARELVSVPGAAGSTLVIDRLASTHADARLVAHLAADEPPENARIVCAMYLADETRGRCRRVTTADLDRNPAVSTAASDASPSPVTSLLDAGGLSYRIREVAPTGDFRELRWTRSHPGSDDGYDVLTLRDVVGRLEDYEPARTITFDMLVLLGEGGRPSTCRLRSELERLTDSSIVLNRGLREAVQRKVARGEMTLSEIALRCGRLKRDRRGNVSGETSWLARRIGQMPEGGESKPTPWIHSETLALIARDGLGGSPHEMELG
jgi:hypothetical protein